MEGVVAQGERVRALREQEVGQLGRDSHAARRVLAVDHGEQGLVPVLEPRQEVAHRVAPRLADHVAEEEEGVGHEGKGKREEGRYFLHLCPFPLPFSL